MIWSLEEIKTAISSHSSELDANKFNISLFNPEMKIGIGTQGPKKVIFIAPSQNQVSARETKNVIYNPNLNFTWEEKGTSLDNLSMLICEVDKTDSQVLDAVSAVFFGLLELVSQNKQIGFIILELIDLFDSGFKYRPSDSSVIGLMGELVLINSSNEMNSLIESWHVKPDSNYDFSVHNRRVEVKTSTGTKRIHNFSSTQLPTKDDQQLRFVSINLPQVSIGKSLAQLYSLICKQIDTDKKDKLYTLICKTLKLPPELVIQPQFDLESALNSLKYYFPEQIPTPEKVNGVITMHWSAELTESEGSDCGELVEWLFHNEKD
jgi:hypothetical protein